MRLRLVTVLNLVLIVTLGTFLAWDYTAEYRADLRTKRVDLNEVATAVLRTLPPENDPQPVIDEVCRRLESRSAHGHHIALRRDGRFVQANTPYRSDAMANAMVRAAQNPTGTADVDGDWFVVGHAGNDTEDVYISESIANVDAVMRSEITRRVASILLLTAILAFVLNWLVRRTVTRPLNAVVQTVRQMRSEGPGARIPPMKSQEFGYLADEFNSMSTALAEVERTRAVEMQKARLIQQHLIPPEDAAAGMNVAHLYLPAEMVAGDHVDIAARREGEVIFCIADVTGHGIPAAMCAVMLKTLFSLAARQTRSPWQILEFVNRHFAAAVLSEDFATMTVITATPGARRWVYANAGHEPALLLHTDGRTTSLPPTGPLLGLAGLSGWQDAPIDVAPGDRLLLFTDGLRETMSPTGEFFGDHLAEVIERNRGCDIKTLITRIAEAAAAHRGAAPQQDDITLLAIEA